VVSARTLVILVMHRKRKEIDYSTLIRCLKQSVHIIDLT